MSEKPTLKPSEIEEERDIADLPQQEGVYNAGRPEEIKRKAVSKKQKERQIADAWAALLRTPDGRAWMAWLLFDVCAVHRTVVNQAFDTSAMLYREGIAEVGRTVEREALKHNRDQYMVLLKEHMPEI